MFCVRKRFTVDCDSGGSAEPLLHTFGTESFSIRGTATTTSFAPTGIRIRALRVMSNTFSAAQKSMPSVAAAVEPGGNAFGGKTARASLRQIVPTN